MSLFYGKMDCNRIPRTSRCRNRINQGKCPLIINPEATVKDHTLCMTTIREAQHEKISLLIYIKWEKIGYPKTSWEAEKEKKFLC